MTHSGEYQNVLSNSLSFVQNSMVNLQFLVIGLSGMSNMHLMFQCASYTETKATSTVEE